jgi:transcriptional regulator with XRE-family HTH domain
MANAKTLEELLIALTETLSPATIVASATNASISATIAVMRDAMGLSRNEMAKLMRVSSRTISKWERGDHNYTVRELAAIADKLNLDLNITMTPRQPVGTKKERNKDEEK